MKKEVIKASNIIHVYHSISLVQQKIFNYLLAHSFDDLEIEEEHNISLAELKKYLEIRDIKYIQENIKQLAKQFTHVLINKDKTCSQRDSFSLLRQIKFEEKSCYYVFSDQTVEITSRPKMYAKLNLDIIKKFKSKHTLLMYELCIDYKGVGRALWFTFSKLRNYFGFNGREYSNFTLFSFHVLKKAIKEVQAKTNLQIELAYQYDKNIQKICFIIKENKDITLTKNVKEKLKVLPAANCTLTPTEAILTNHGILLPKAKMLAQKFAVDVIKQKISMLEQNKTQVKNKAAWLIKAIEQNWSFTPTQLATQVKTNIAPMYKKVEDSFYILQKLEKEHLYFLENSITEVLQNLSKEKEKQLEVEFKNWSAINANAITFFGITPKLKRSFYTTALIAQDDRNFIIWAGKRGFKIEKVNGTKKLVSWPENYCA